MGIAPNIGAFGAFRAIALFAAGGIMPVLIALLGEYTPVRYRLTVVGSAFLGIQVGSILMSFLGMSVMMVYGWRVIYHLAWIFLILVPVVLLLVPESLVYYNNHNNMATIRKYLPQVNRNYVPEDDDSYEFTRVAKERVSVAALFTEHRGFSTIMLWIMYALGLLTVYILNTWLPTIITDLGYSLGSGISVATIFYFGALLGTLTVGRLADKFGGKKILSTGLFICALCILLLAINPPFIVIMIFIFLVGTAAFGAVNASNSWIPQYYPQSMRATAAGWGVGMGRFGSVIAPTFAGMILAQQFSMTINFAIFAIPCILAGIAVLLVQMKYSYDAQEKIESSK
jgi:AAHS family benzoate transporter-like MFS transporter